MPDGTRERAAVLLLSPLSSPKAEFGRCADPQNRLRWRLPFMAVRFRAIAFGAPEYARSRLLAKKE